MGHPLSGGYCKGCRGIAPGASFCKADREKGWNPSNKIIYKDPTPLMGDLQFPLKERLRREFPIRRNPNSVCDCQKCKAGGTRRGLDSYACLHSPSPRKTKPATPGRSPGHGYGPGQCTSERGRQPSTPVRSPGGSRSPKFEPRKYTAFYDDDDDYADEVEGYLQESYQQKYSSINDDIYTPNREEEIAYRKLMSAFETIRGAVVEQQQYERSHGGHSPYQLSPAASHFLSTPPHYQSPGGPKDLTYSPSYYG
eukprot:TRINITY_DN4435_c0_g2_i1.p1 TRINITY_DN4435_c0_g2~~TRINITY_DN4435_c0_g2_i1.p1  ORF type:complete len:272 (+),score=81.02 TRINITY_DN4435_c0_g2_i1:58-816(+)